MQVLPLQMAGKLQTLPLQQGWPLLPQLASQVPFGAQKRLGAHWSPGSPGQHVWPRSPQGRQVPEKQPRNRPHGLPLAQQC